MTPVAPREALAYALSREMAVLYLLVGAGYVVLLGGAWAASSLAGRGGGGGVLGAVLAAVLLAVGFVVLLGGLVGLVYKVIADANRAAR